MDYRVEFSKWWVSEFKTIKFPSQGTVFDYVLDVDTKRWTPWTERLPAFELDPEIPLQVSTLNQPISIFLNSTSQAVLVHTAETVRLGYFLDLLMAHRRPVLLVGGAGCGKTVLVNEKLSKRKEDVMVTTIPFNHYTTSMMLQGEQLRNQRRSA